MSKGNVAILLSGRGSNFAAIVRASRAGGANFAVRLAVSDRADAAGPEKGRPFRHPRPLSSIPRASPTRPPTKASICALLEREAIDLVCLAGYMRLVGPVLLGRYRGRILNIHPALLPSFPGLDAQRQALRYGVEGQRLHRPFRRRRHRHRADHRPAGGGGPSRTTARSP